MRCWPKALAERYPPPHGAVPDRPWWVAGHYSNATAQQWDAVQYHRPADGAVIWVSSGRDEGRRYSGAACWWTARELSAYPEERPSGRWCLPGRDTLPIFQAVAACDAALPLPHPGFRVGQVWAFAKEDWLSEGCRRGFAIVSVKRDSTWNDGAREIKFSGEIPWPAGPRSTFRSAVGHHFSDLAAMESYLLADPCCPWLAPWASSERK